MSAIRVRSKARPAPVDQLEPGDRALLEIGPSPRQSRRADWPIEEARLGVLWRLHRSELLAASPPGRRPWGFLRFDVPEAVRLPGATRDALVSRGTIHPDDVALQDVTEETP